MCNNNSRSAVGEISTVAALTVKKERFIVRNDQDASETCAKFLKAAALLPQDGCLGFQLNAGKEGFAAFAFAGEKGKTTLGDLDWVFNQMGEVSNTDDRPALDLFTGSRRVYALIKRPPTDNDDKQEAKTGIDDCEEYEGCTPGSVRWFTDVFDELVSVGAMLRLTMEAGENGMGSILVSLPGELSLKLRAMLALALPDVSEVELTSPLELHPGMAALPVKTFACGMIGLLASMLQKASRDYMDLPFSDDDDDELRVETEEDDDTEERRKDCVSDSASIEELELSVRTFNALKRAGISSVGELRRKSDEELMSIRSLNEKCLKEIREKLREIEPPASVPAARSESLDELIGLQDVKEQVRRITAYARMKKHMAEQGRPSIPVVLNMGFVGNPGTAKTTVARILAGMLCDIGLLESDELIEVGRADLVGKYEGHTADRVKEVFRRAKGKLLFIDEAYSLIENIRGGFGDEAIDTIVQEMENNRNDTVVVFAGYPDKMLDFISRNPGLRSRVPFIIGFSDYSVDEMAEIAALEAKKRGFSIADDAKETVRSMCEKAKQNSENGNGRFCRNLVEDAVLSYASRVYGASVPESADFVLRCEDFALPKTAFSEKKGKPIGFAA